MKRSPVLFPDASGFIHSPASIIKKLIGALHIIGVLDCAANIRVNGNTDYETPLREALRLMEQEGFENADMVFVTDGECVLPDSFLEKLKAEQSVRGFQITGILLDQEDAGFEFSLREFCTNVYRTSQLSRDQIAEQLVVSRVA